MNILGSSHPASYFQNPLLLFYLQQIRHKTSVALGYHHPILERPLYSPRWEKQCQATQTILLSERLRRVILGLRLLKCVVYLHVLSHV